MGYFKEKVTVDMPSLNNKGHRRYTSGSKARIMEMCPSVAINFESVTDNVAFRCRQFQISCDLIGLIMSVCNITFLERQGHRQELINSRCDD